MYLNKVYIVGHITRDPELKSMPNGNKVASFSVATNRVWKDNNGAKQESAEFHNIVVFGRQAETCAQYLKKGQQVLIEGRLQTRSWDDKNTNEKKYRTEIIAENVQFGMRPDGVKKPSKEQEKSDFDQKEENDQKEDDQVPTIEYDDEVNLSDIPF